jgi:hypothetical protein
MKAEAPGARCRRVPNGRNACHWRLRPDQQRWESDLRIRPEVIVGEEVATGRPLALFIESWPTGGHANSCASLLTRLTNLGHWPFPA